MAVFRLESEEVDSVVIVFRHATLAVMQYDSSVNRFKTVSQACFASEVELKPSIAFRAPFVRVSGNVVVTQFTPLTLTYIQIGSELISYTVPVKLKSTLGLSSIHDIQFASVPASGTVSLAILGKSEPHAWVGREATVGSKAATIRLVTVDVSRKSMSVNWSFENLPTESFSLIPLPKPKGGFLVASPDNVSYCEEFSSSVTLPVNPAGSDAAARINFLRLDEEFDIDLTSARAIALSDELVLLATRSGDLLGCHLVRQSGAFNSVSDVVWERYSIPEKILGVASLSLVAGDKLFIGSSQSTSFLFKMSTTEILLPISVFPSSSEEMRLTELDQSLDESAGKIKELLADYQDEVHRAKISHSVEFGLLDELEGNGTIYSLARDRDEEGAGILAACGGGSLVSLSSHVDLDLVFELQLKDMRFVVHLSYLNHHLLVLANEARLLLIDCGNGLRELGRLDFASPILGIAKTVTDDGHVVVVTTAGLVKVAIVTAKQEHPLDMHVWHSWSAAPIKAVSIVNNWIIAQSNSSALQILNLDNWEEGGAKKIELPEGREIVSFSASRLIESLHVCVSDSQGSLYIFSESGDALFFSRHASVCKSVLPNELGTADQPADEFVLSVTDITKRPLEPNTSTSLFSEKLRIHQAFVYQKAKGDDVVLVMLIEGRPVLVYTLVSGSGSFVLKSFDSVPILFEKSESQQQYFSVTEQGLAVSVTPSQSVLIAISDKGQMFAHPYGIGGFCDLSPFSSEYVDNGLVSLTVPDTKRSQSCALRIFKYGQSDIYSRFPKNTVSLGDQGPGSFPLNMAVSVPGVAVTTVSEEIDPGLIVPLAPVAHVAVGEEDSMMHDDGAAGFDVSPAPGSTVLLTCPVPPKRQKHQIRVVSGSERTIAAIIDLQPSELVTGLVWADSVLGLGPDVLIIGTTFALGEETPAQGRIIVVRIDYAPGVTASAVTLGENQVVAGGKILYDSLKRAAVSVVKAWKGCVAVGLAHRLMMYQWDGVAGRLRGVGMIDLGLQITSLSFFKSFILAGDVLRGVYLLRYKEDPVMDVNMNVMSMAASVQQLAKTFPFQEFSAINVETIRNNGAVGIVSLDVFGNIDLEVFSPVTFGQYLRHSVPFNLPSKSVAVLPVYATAAEKALLIGTAAGGLCHLIPISESEHHLASSLVGLMVALLPQPGGVNPRLHHVCVGRETLPNSVQAIESIDSLVDFLYLATPLQAEIANRLKQPIDVLMRTVARWLTPIL